MHPPHHPARPQRPPPPAQPEGPALAVAPQDDSPAVPAAPQPREVPTRDFGVPGQGHVQIRPDRFPRKAYVRPHPHPEDPQAAFLSLKREAGLEAVLRHPLEELEG
eukprot:9103693-Alexandrium_andersonii.AAC.1